MKLSRDWLSDYVDLSGLSDDDLAQRFTEIGHAVDSVEAHEGDTVFDLEITTNRVDAMSHLGMARELAAALGRKVIPSVSEGSVRRAAPTGPDSSPTLGMTAVRIRIDVPDMCSRYTGLAIRGVDVKL